MTPTGCCNIYMHTLAYSATGSGLLLARIAVLPMLIRQCGIPGGEDYDLPTIEKTTDRAMSVYEEDLYSEAAILEPYGHYRAIRELGPAVWLSSNNVWAMGRYADVVAALRDHKLFSSAAGIAISDQTNKAALGTTISSDPPLHDEFRKLIGAPLTPAAVNSLRTQIEAAAETHVEGLVAKGRFDAATDLARHLPLTIVSHMVGLLEGGRENMLTWAAATFDLFGPENDRARKARPITQEMRSYINSISARGKVKPGSWADRLLDYVESGLIKPEQFATLLRDYLGPSLDTTIFATSSLIWLFSCYPEQWDIVRADPSLIRNALNEAVRLESPIRGFTRRLTEDFEIEGTMVPAGSRMLLLYASANRDERKWELPEAFDVRRKVTDQVGFGFGVHSCAGMHLARLEIECLVKALIPRVGRFEATKPIRAVNNTLRGFTSLPVRVV